MSEQHSLKDKVEQQVKRMQKAERERPHLLAQTIYIGTLGLVMVLPIIGGAYLGQWLDSLLDGYSMHWTLSLLLIGVVVGFFNVYFLIQDRDSDGT